MAIIDTAVKSAASKVTSQATKIASNIANNVGSEIKKFASDDPINRFKEQTMFFPTELSTNPIPVVMFTAHYKEGNEASTSIALPCPGNISVTDSGNYGSKELGATGAIREDLIAKVLGHEAGLSAEEIIKQNKTHIGVNVASMIVDKLTSDYAEAMYVNKVITNPNTVTTFTSNGIRNYSYSFKLVANSELETTFIKDIIYIFRTLSYAGTENSSTYSFFLKYPPIWTIKYLFGEELEENQYISRAFTCFLTSFATTYNGAAGSTFYYNGAPIEIDITMQFQETRVLFKSDVEKLELGYPLTVEGGAGRFTTITE